MEQLGFNFDGLYDGWYPDEDAPEPEPWVVIAEEPPKERLLLEIQVPVGDDESVTVSIIGPDKEAILYALSEIGTEEYMNKVAEKVDL